MQGDFAAGVALLRAKVSPVKLGESLHDNHSEPDEQRRFVIALDVRKALGSADVGFLENIVGVQPSGETLIQPKQNGLGQPGAVFLERCDESLKVAGSYSLDAVVRCLVVARHIRFRSKRARTERKIGTLAGFIARIASAEPAEPAFLHKL